MSKRERHDTILEIVREERVGSHEQLREFLGKRGIEVTQATLSRDVRELRLVKVQGADGQPYYTLPDEWENTPPLEQLLPTLFVSARGAGNLLVVKTMTGGAQAVALGIDWEEWPEVLGSIAGDDTILLVLRSEDEMDEVIRRVEAIVEAGRRTRTRSP